MELDKEEKNYDIKDRAIIQHGLKINLERMIMVHQGNNYMVIIQCGW